MSINLPLLTQIIDAGRAAGLDQARLARTAGVAAETISRAKKRGTIELNTLQALAQAAGLKLALTNLDSTAQQPAVARSSLADPSRGLAWSNPDISNEALVRNALIKGSFHLLLEAVLGHGLPFVQKQWALLTADTDVGLSARTRAEISRKLAHIEQGMNHAAA